jgi:zinc transporter, ZIP family
MTDNTTTARPNLLWLALPFAVLALAIAWLYTADPLGAFRNGAPPIEQLTVERTILSDSGLSVLVRGGGSQPMTIAQVQVDDAYWEFTQEPTGPIGRGATAWIKLPFPWVLGEAHTVVLVTNTGTLFEHEIAVAVPTPTLGSIPFLSQTLLGLFVGVLPVALGLMFFPVLRGVGRNGMSFLLALTVGLLAFLLIEAILDSLALATESAAIFQGPTMVILAATTTFLLLMGISHRAGKPSGLALSGYVALGIGLHNLGEGLAIGAAFATGAADLGLFLVLGFTLHNVTEGIAISAPILKQRPPLWAFAGLALLAGAPATIGLWLGSLAYAPQWSALALAIGAGAILQVIVEIGSHLRGDKGEGFYTPFIIAGLIAGVGIMFATAMLVKI